MNSRSNSSLTSRYNANGTVRPATKLSSEMEKKRTTIPITTSASSTRPSKATRMADQGNIVSARPATNGSSLKSPLPLSAVDSGKASRPKSSTTTIRTTVTTFTTKPRLRPAKETPPLFNVTNHTPSLPRTTVPSIPTKPKRDTSPSKTQRRVSQTSLTSPSSVSSSKSFPARKPPSATSTLGSTVSTKSFSYQSGPTRTKVSVPRPAPILKKSSPPKKVIPIEERPIPPECVRCDVCKRGFMPDRLSKHRDVCFKLENRPKKVFNATKMRTEGTELETYIRRGVHKKEIPVKKSNWRAKHEEFLQNVREAKKVQVHLANGGKLSDLPPPKPSENPDYVPCPHCGRKFNEGAAERHIPKCANILSNKKKTPTTSRSVKR